MTNRPLIALISATPAAIGPATTGLAQEFPEAAVWNLLDDQLLSAADEAGGLTPRLSQRMERLIGHALAEGADGVLLTCSIYGAVAQATQAAVPVLAPDDAAFAEALGGEYRRILIVASFETALNDVTARFSERVRAAGGGVEVLGVAVPAAFDATRAGDDAALLKALEEACRRQSERFDAVLLAQYSLAPAAAALSASLGLPVISGPLSAARTLRAQLNERTIRS